LPLVFFLFPFSFLLSFVTCPFSHLLSLFTNWLRRQNSNATPFFAYFQRSDLFLVYTDQMGLREPAYRQCLDKN
jgi:hypothetical protein